MKILGCGSACYAGDLGAQLIEDLARMPATSESASEFRYRNPVVEPDTLYVAVSQSGETVDTLAAVQELQRKGGRVIGIVNVVGSTIARQCDGGIYLHAGAGDVGGGHQVVHLDGRGVRAAGAAPGPHARPLAERRASGSSTG